MWLDLQGADIAVKIFCLDKANIALRLMVSKLNRVLDLCFACAHGCASSTGPSATGTVLC